MLKAENLSVSYGAINALKSVTFEINAGEIVALIGANGAGKTTTLNTISGVVEPKNGTVFFKGKEITKMDPHQIVRLGISQVPEGRRVFPKMTVLENLEMGAYIRSDKAGIKQDLEAVFARFPRLAERKKQPAKTLSGGEQQMLAMGRALMARPQLLLMDEPSMGLAPILVEEIFKIIEEISKAGTTILLVEQNAHMALSVADRGYVLETGEVVLQGIASDLITNPEIRRAYLGE